jgi:hypothetical protein
MMHRPWDHAVALKNVFQDGRITSTSINERVRNDLQHAHDLHELATKKRIPIVEPFAEGNQPSKIRVEGGLFMVAKINSIEDVRDTTGESNLALALNTPEEDVRYLWKELCRAGDVITLKAVQH